MKNSPSKITSYLLIMAAATCWGIIGLANRALEALGFNQGMIVLFRPGIAFIALAVILLCTNRAALRIRLKDIWCFIGTGILSLTFFNYCYTTTMMYMNLSAAAVLLYTAPVFVVLISAPLFKERITAVKILALVLVLFGACCTTGLIGSFGSISLIGIGYGLLSGFGYALYSIFSRFALNKGYSPNTISLYTFLFSALGALFLTRPADFAQVSVTPELIGWCLFLGLICCLIPYLLYTKGLSGVENGRASVVASLELVVATLTGVIAFGEGMTPLNTLGVLLVLAGIFAINLGDILHKTSDPDE